VTTLKKSLPQTDQCSQSHSSLQCLVAASNGVASSSSVSNRSCPFWLAPFRCKSQAAGFQLSDTLTVSRLSCCWSSPVVHNKDFYSALNVYAFINRASSSTKALHLLHCSFNTSTSALLRSKSLWTLVIFLHTHNRLLSTDRTKTLFLCFCLQAVG
jgi:hypothetical protein